MRILISDPTLRDGNHAVKHSLKKEDIKAYCKIAEKIGINIVEVGHGNGIGASSIQVGLSKLSDKLIIKTARNHLKKTKLSVHSIPGFSSIDNNLAPAIDLGVDIVRVASHCSESNTQFKQIEYCKKKAIKVHSTLMLCHMISEKKLLKDVKELKKVGTDAVILMDSAGSLSPEEVSSKINILKKNINIKVGFHGHNNLSFAVMNSIKAIQNGADIVDATTFGFGAGAGNTSLQTLFYALKKYKIKSSIKEEFISELNFVSSKFAHEPSSSYDSLLSGYYGIFSGFKNHIIREINQNQISKEQLYKEISKYKPVAGQEDIVITAAKNLKEKNEKK